MRTNTAAATNLLSTTTTDEAPMTTSTATTRKNRKPRIETTGTAAEQLAPATFEIVEAPALEAEVELAEVEIAAKPELSAEAQAALDKQRAKLEREEKIVARRRAQVAALENGEPLPTSTKGLPPVVKMNEIGALARQLHRATLLAASVEAVELMNAAGIGGGDVTSAAYALGAATDEAVRRWSAQHQLRRDAGAADNDTLHPLGLVRDEETGNWKLVEKTKPAAG